MTTYVSSTGGPSPTDGELLSRAARRPLPLLVLLLLLVGAVRAWARAGGGHSFGDGGSGGGGDSGLGDVIFFLVFLAIDHPAIGVPLLVVVVIVAIVGGRKVKDTHVTGTIRKGVTVAGRAEEMAQRTGIEAIAARDPGFSPAAFLGRCGRAFLAVQRAWSAQDLGAVRGFITQGVRERFELQFEMQRAEGLRNDMRDVRVLGSRIVAVVSGRALDEVTVELSAQARDADVALADGRELRVNTTEPFTEYWTFMRRPGAKTLEKGGLVEGMCPNCGAPLQLSDAGQCPFCKAFVTSGEHDWLLAEITQAAAWSPSPPPARVPGLAEIEARDPELSVAHVEDRASTVFWRVMRSYFRGDTAPLDPVCAPQLAATVRAGIARSPEGWWTFYDEAAVGAVELLGARPGGKGELDFLDVLVTWSARNAERNAAGTKRGRGEKSIRLQVLTLARSSGARSTAASRFRSAPCHGCGAPDGGTGTGACPYCGSPTNDGSRDWVLVAVAPVTAEQLQELRQRQRQASPRGGRAQLDMILSGMAAVMVADGEVDSAEAQMLYEFSKARGVPRETIVQLLASIRSGVPLPRPQTPQEAGEIVAAMARVALADGKIAHQEEAMLVAFGGKAGMSPADVKLVLSRERAGLYRESRALIRESKRTVPPVSP